MFVLSAGINKSTQCAQAGGKTFTFLAVAQALLFRCHLSRESFCLHSPQLLRFCLQCQLMREGFSLKCQLLRFFVYTVISCCAIVYNVSCNASAFVFNVSCHACGFVYNVTCRASAFVSNVSCCACAFVYNFSCCACAYLSAGVLAPTLDTIIGIFWSIPPLTLNPNRPCSSGMMVIITMPLLGSVAEAGSDPLAVVVVVADAAGVTTNAGCSRFPRFRLFCLEDNDDDPPGWPALTEAGPIGNLSEMGVSLTVPFVALEWMEPEPLNPEWLLLMVRSEAGEESTMQQKHEIS
jgi:hypothetical protein